MTLDEAFCLQLAIRETLRQVKLPPFAFSFALAKTSAALGAQIKLAQEAVRVGVDTDMLDKFAAMRRTLAYERCMKDLTGNPIMAGSEPVVSVAEVDAIMAELAVMFPEAEAQLVFRAAITKEAGAREVEVVLTKVPLADWPDVPGHLVEQLQVLVEEPA